jgi:hypothetical protein
MSDDVSFRSKVDAWLIAVIATAVVFVAAQGFQLRETSPEGSVISWSVAALVGAKVPESSGQLPGKPGQPASILRALDSALLRLLFPSKIVSKRAGRNAQRGFFCLLRFRKA